MAAGEVEEISVEPQDEGELAVAKPHRALGNGVKHRLHVSRRPRDDAQDIAGRSLVFERLGQLARALLFALKQPRVLDCDHCLVGEGSDQVDLFVDKGLHRLARKYDDADRAFFAQERDSESSAIATPPLGFLLREFRIGQYIWHLYRSGFEQSSPDDRPSTLLN